MVDEATEVQSLLTDEDRSAKFPCMRRRRVVSERYCIDGFMNAHAYKNKTDKCWGCPVGAALRVRWAYDKEPTEIRVEAALGIASGRPKPWHYARLGVGGEVGKDDAKDVD